MKIEPATLSDCRGVAEVHVESWQHAYKNILPSEYLASLSIAKREAMWTGIVERQSSHLLVAREAGRIVGFVAFGPAHGEAASRVAAEISAICVRPAFWSTGIGRQLWLDALREMLSEGYETISLWVLAGNVRASKFYERVGFPADPESRRHLEIGGATVDEMRFVFQATAQPGNWRSFMQLRERLGPVRTDFLDPRKPREQ
ncbi:MAG TPA: GNAT family N-acetyltransferase [Variovorax sp.]|nr:GNAT family N-acetyltransferase [Variovorax sp.]